MGTELNYFLIRQGQVKRFSDRLTTISPMRFPELCDGESRFSESCKYFRHQDKTYYNAYGEFVIDYDLEIILLFIKYCELGSDAISYAAKIIEKIKKNWSGWRVHWACCGEDQTRHYVDQVTKGNIQYIGKNYLQEVVPYSFLKDIPTFRDSSQTVDNTKYPLDAVCWELKKLAMEYQEKYANEWKILLDYDLDNGSYLYLFKTTLLYKEPKSIYKNFHFRGNVKTLLADSNLIPFCSQGNMSLNDLDFLPDKMRWHLTSVFRDAASIVIDNEQKVLVVAPAPGELKNICRALEMEHWDGWSIVIDLPILVQYWKIAEKMSK